MVPTTHSQIAQHYSCMQILTASQPKVICMLHEKFVSLLHQARDEVERRRTVLDNAQNILAQLQAALKTDDPVAQSLFLLYDYCYVLLERGSPDECENSERIMTTLGTTYLFLMRKM